MASVSIETLAEAHGSIEIGVITPCFVKDNRGKENETQGCFTSQEEF